MDGSECIHACNGNYHLYLFPSPTPELILLSSLDDALYHLQLTQQSLPTSAINMFGQVQELTNFLAYELSNQEKIVVSDVGLIQINELFEVKDRKFKMETHLQARKVVDREEAYQFLLMTVRKMGGGKQSIKKKVKEEGSLKKEQGSVKKEQGSVKKVISLPIEKSLPKAERIFLSIDDRRNFPDSLSAFTKIKNNLYQISKALPSRIKIYFNSIIPQDQCVFFTIKIVKKQGRALALGLIDRRDIHERGTSSTSYSFEFASGEIKDCGSHLEGKETKWRVRGQPTVNLQTVVRVTVDKPSRRVVYECGGVKVGESILNDYMMKAEIIPYLNCQNQGDVYFLNAE